jgi:hypothetical protein
MQRISTEATGEEEEEEEAHNEGRKSIYCCSVESQEAFRAALSTISRN